MSLNHRGRSAIASNPRVPVAVRQAVIEQGHARLQDQVRKGADIAKRSEALMKEHSDALTRIVKADGRRRIEAFRAAERERNATAMNNARNRTLDRTEQLKLQKAGREAYERLLREMNVDAAQIQVSLRTHPAIE